MGHSLIEMLVSVAVMTTLVSFSTLGMIDWLDRIRMQTSVDRMLTFVNIGRTYAITHNVNVTVCPGRELGCGPRNTWHEGSVVFADHNHNRRIDDDEAIVARLPPLEHVRVYWRAFRNRSYLRFTGAGVTDWQNGNLLFCPVKPDVTLARQVILNFAGRMYRSSDADADGIHEDTRGRPLFCPD